MATANTAKRPVHEVRMGRIKSAIWEKKRSKGCVTMSRSRVSIKMVQHGRILSFGRDDLPLVNKVGDMAYMWIYNNASTVPATTEEPADF